MKQRESYDLPLLAVFGAIFFLIYIIQYTDGVFSFNSAIPQLMLPIVVCCGMYWDDRIGAIFGFFLGSCVDAVAADTICYNTISLMLIGYVSGLLIEKIINNNFRASLLLVFGFSLIYYFGCWCMSGFSSGYMSKIYFELVFNTVIFSIPLYWFMRWIINLRKKTLSN